MDVTFTRGETPPISIKQRKFPLTVHQRRAGLEEYLNVTCEKSAKLRGIAPWGELKSILFKGQDDVLFMAHILGDSMVDTKSLRKEVGKVKMCSVEELKSFGLEKGRVNPFTAELYFCLLYTSPSPRD